MDNSADKKFYSIYTNTVNFKPYITCGDVPLVSLRPVLTL